MQAPRLEVRGVTFDAHGRTILRGVDLAVEAGSIHALLGANGTGKTTLACLIMGCCGYRPGAGHIAFEGHPIDGLLSHERARLGITLAWQEPARFEGLSVRRFLTLGPVPADPADLLARVGLDPAAYLDRPMDRTLSGGERKRIELASVLAFRPRVALLDEPGAGIDLASVEEIARVIRAMREGGAAVLLITHQEDFARIADRASLLADGRVAARGDPAEVAARYRQGSRPARAAGGRGGGGP